MYNLLQSNCLASVERELGDKSNMGRIRFEGGELYEGELSGSNPKGEGSFLMRDGSSYTGIFEEFGIISGEFQHFSGAVFEGKFLREKFSKGTLKFPDGDSLTGEWGFENNKWVLKRGVFHPISEDQGPQQLSSSSSSLAEHSGKKIYAKHDFHGFAVFWDKVVLPDNVEIKNLVLGAEGTIAYEKKDSPSMVSKQIRVTNSLLTHDLIEKFNAQSVSIGTIHRFDMGIVVESTKRSELIEARFVRNSQLVVKGSLEISKAKFKISGTLFQGSNILGSIKIKQTTMKPFQIVFNDTIYNSISLFLTALGLNNTSNQNSSSQKLPRVNKNQHLIRKEDKPAKPMGLSVLKMMITTLQKSSDSDVKKEVQPVAAN